MILISERFIHRLAELTENDEIAWKQKGEYVTTASPYEADYNGAHYVLRSGESRITLEIFRDGKASILYDECVRTHLFATIIYKEYIDWEVQEHIKEVLGEEDGVQ